MEAAIQAAEVEASRHLARVLMHGFDDGGPAHPAAVAAAVAGAAAIEADLAGALAATSRAALLLDGALLEAGGDGGSGGLDEESLRVHSLQLRQLRLRTARASAGFRAFLRREGLAARRPTAAPVAGGRGAGGTAADASAAAAANGAGANLASSSLMAADPTPAAAAARRRSSRPPAPPQSVPMLARASTAATAAALKRTRLSMEAELERLAGVGGLLDADAASLARTGDEHAAYGADVTEARQRAKAYVERARRDRRAMCAAAALLLVSAAYIVARRLAWTLLGRRLPP